MNKIVFVRLLCVISFIGISSISIAQPPHPTIYTPLTPVKVGSVIVNGGIGAGTDYESDYYNSRFGLKAAIEWGLLPVGPSVITLGGEVGGSFSNGGYINYDNYHANTILIGARAAWHYGWEVRGLDTYVGVSGGVGIHHYQYDDSSGSISHYSAIAVPGIFVGASYFVTQFFGFNAEVGHDITDFQIGIVIKTRH